MENGRVKRHSFLGVSVTVWGSVADRTRRRARSCPQRRVGVRWAAAVAVVALKYLTRLDHGPGVSASV